MITVYSIMVDGRFPTTVEILDDEGIDTMITYAVSNFEYQIAVLFVSWVRSEYAVREGEDVDLCIVLYGIMNATEEDIVLNPTFDSSEQAIGKIFIKLLDSISANIFVFNMYSSNGFFDTA